VWTRAAGQGHAATANPARPIPRSRERTGGDQLTTHRHQAGHAGSQGQGVGGGRIGVLAPGMSGRLLGLIPLRLSTPRPKRLAQPRPSQRAERSPTPSKIPPQDRANRPTTAITTKRVLECAERMRLRRKGALWAWIRRGAARVLLTSSETRKGRRRPRSQGYQPVSAGVKRRKDKPRRRCHRRWHPDATGDRVHQKPIGLGGAGRPAGKGSDHQPQ